MLLTVRIFEQMYAGLFFIFIRSEASLFFFSSCASLHKMAAGFLRRNTTEFCG